MIIKNLEVEGVLKDINLKFEKGKITNIMGENGSGKSTLLRCIADLEEYSGYIDAKNIKKGLVFQNPYNQFIRNIVEDDLAFSLEKFNISRIQMKKKILQISKEFDIEHLLGRYISSLSGGELQKIALVANILLEPKILLLDESFEMIDYTTTKKILKNIRQYVSKHNIVCIHVTHNTDLIESLDNIVYLKDQKILYSGCMVEFFKLKNIEKLNIKLPIYKKLEKKLGIEINSTQEMRKILCKLN